jgi:menaquinone-dependent protoporphyrinogen IX oxidase
MSKLFICPKQRGNTFTVCDYISKHTDIDLKFINKQEIFRLDKYKTIILCSGVYMGKAHSNLTKWLKNITKNQIVENTKFYMFMTWFGRGKSDRNVLKKIDSYLKRVDAKLEDNYSTCFGQGMGIIRIGHPDNTDFEKILTWVNNL